MDRRTSYANPFVRDHIQEDSHPEFEQEDGPDSPSSEDEVTKISATSAQKKRKSTQKKRVVSVRIGDGDVNGARSKGEAYPPSDSWAWRKYGQKPIKGSPFPSSSKGCPARKQVDRSRVDPTVLLVTYASAHNHPLPASSARNHHHHRAAESPASAPGSPPSEVSVSPGDPSGLIGHPDIRGDPLFDLDWLASDADSTSLLESPVWAVDCLGLGADGAFAYGMMREEDVSLFGDLEELPECTAVFGRKNAMEPEE